MKLCYIKIQKWKNFLDSDANKTDVRCFQSLEVVFDSLVKS